MRLRDNRLVQFLKGIVLRPWPLVKHARLEYKIISIYLFDISGGAFQNRKQVTPSWPQKRKEIGTVEKIEAIEKIETIKNIKKTEKIEETESSKMP